MANKAVIGVMAAGLAGYALTEKVRDMQVEREKKEREQEWRDRKEESERRLEEKLRKQGNKSFEAHMHGIENDRMIKREFQRNFFSCLEQMLFDLCVEVGEIEGKTNNRNFQTMNLPLMSNDCDKDDLMLAAALVLGDSAVVDRVFESFSKQRLGIGLKKVSERSIRKIINVFQSLKDPDIDHISLGIFITIALQHDSSGKPRLFIPKDAPSYSDSLRRWGGKFGIFVSPKSWMEMSSKMPRKFGQSYYVKFDFDEGSDHGADTESGLIFSNFRCSFEVPGILEDGFITMNYDAIRLLKRNPKRCTPDLDAIANAFASKVVAGMAGEAAKRLSKLLKLRRDKREGISLEHISMVGGKGSDLLKNLCEADMTMISGHKEIITSTLFSTLLKSVPPPDETDLHDGESPQGMLDAEVTTFVGAYIQLVNLSYCDVPLLSGHPPSAFVPKYNVFGEVTQQEGCVYSGDPIMSKGVTRIQIKDERERLARSRELVAPGTLYSALFILFTCGVFFWLWVVVTKKLLPNLILLCITNLALSLWTMIQSYRMIGSIFRIPDQSSYWQWQYYWKVASYCTEFIQHLIAAKLGMPTPYNQQMSKLKEQCASQYRVWKMRIAKREFQAALKRKRITNRESVLLLTEMADSYYETEEEEVVEGVFQAELNEVEEFLKLQVEEETAYSEVTLSPDDAIKNYLDLTSGETDTSHSPLAQLGDLGATIEECVLFSEGDRVLVKFDDEAKAEYSRRGNVTASVVFTTSSRVYVHFDGEPAETPIPVPTHLCSKLVEDLPAIEDAKTPLSTQTTCADASSDESDNKSTITESEEEIEEPSTSTSARERVRTVEEALIDGGWKLTRNKKHIVYSRRVKLTKDGPFEKQTVTLLKTPSDWRAEKKALSLLRRLESEVVGGSPEVVGGEVVGGSPQSVIEEVFSCSECRKVMSTAHFSKAQLKKRRRRKCKDCVSGTRG